MAGTTGKERNADRDQQLVEDAATLAGALMLLFGGRSGEQSATDKTQAHTDAGSEMRTASEIELRLLKTALEAGKSIVEDVVGEIAQQLGDELRQEWHGLMAELDAEIAAKREPTE